jgi:hypothetical protein
VIAFRLAGEPDPTRLMPKGPRTDVLTLAALGAAAALGIGFLIVRGAGGGATNPLAAVPADSFLVVTVDIASLAQSPLGETLVGQLKGEAGARAGTILGVDSITETCGFDPLPHLRAIAIAVPEGGERGDFGIAASGTLTKDALASCARAVLAKRGGEASTRQEGSFTVVSDARTPGGAEVAFRDGGPYLVGRGIWLTRMIDAADGRTASTLSASNDTHAALRADLKTRDVDAEALRATAILPHDLRERLQGELARETSQTAASHGDKSSPPANKATANKTMEGVLGVSAVALGIHAGRPHEDTRLVAELRCDSDAACDAVSTFILHTRLGWSGNLGYRLFGLGPLIDNLQIQHPPSPGGSASANVLYVQTRTSTDDLVKIIDRVLRPTAPAKPNATSTARSPVPDETVSAANKDAGR